MSWFLKQSIVGQVSSSVSGVATHCLTPSAAYQLFRDIYNLRVLLPDICPPWFLG